MSGEFLLGEWFLVFSIAVVVRLAVAVSIVSHLSEVSSKSFRW